MAHVYTSNFSTAHAEPNAISIAKSSPKWYHGLELKQLAPPWELVYGLKNGVMSQDEYTKRYITQLNRFHPSDVAEWCDNRILLCWCSPTVFCHRHVLADWLRAYGHEVEEFQQRSQEIWLPPERQRERDSCLWCKHGKLGVDKTPIRLKCHNKQSAHYNRLTKSPTRSSCELWEYKYLEV